MHRFSFYLRNGIYYARFYNSETKKNSSGRSTREQDKMSALVKVALWDKYGFDQKDNQTTEIDDFLKVNTIKTVTIQVLSLS